MGMLQDQTRSATWETPFALAYGPEAIIPIGYTNA